MQLLLALCALLSFVGAQDTSDGQDPFLQYRPEFARSLPVQILCSGIVLTLVFVLLIHLIFTAQYHWSLAQVNYVSQLASVVALLIVHVVTLHLVLSETIQESQSWPYMLSYAAPTPYPSDWEIGKRATWHMMFAVSTGLIQITQIQFLTLLYPSRLEVTLIFLFLIPLSISSATMQLLKIHPSDQVQDLASAGRHVCNATLYLLFTVALFNWGFLANRQQAWRSDGGTAVFGAVTLTLALFSTTLYFLYVATEHLYTWLSGLLLTVVVWQSFLGWWWWVGAGSGLGVNGKLSVGERILQAEKREQRKREKFEKKARAKSLWKGVTRSFSKSHRSGKGTTVAPSFYQGPEHSSNNQPPAPPTADGPRSLFPRIIFEWYNALRNAHRAAAREQNAERAERILEMERDRVMPVTRLNPWIGSKGTRVGDDSRGGNLARERFSGEERLSEIREQGPHNDVERQGEVEVPSRQEEDSHSRQKSMLWWGPLRRWRLQDVTSYA